MERSEGGRHGALGARQSQIISPSVEALQEDVVSKSAPGPDIEVPDEAICVKAVLWFQRPRP